MMLLRWRIYGNILFVHSFDLGHIFWISKIDLSQAKSFLNVHSIWKLRKWKSNPASYWKIYRYLLFAVNITATRYIWWNSMIHQSELPQCAGEIQISWVVGRVHSWAALSWWWFGLDISVCQPLLYSNSQVP